MKIFLSVGGDIMSNGYVIYDEESGEAYIIDPGFNAGRFLEFVKTEDLSVKGILLTHHHYDHVGAAGAVMKALGCKAFIHELDAGHIRFAAETFIDGRTFPLGDVTVTAAHTPGHTRGSCCFCCDTGDHFTGDTIFDTDIGRTDLEDGQPYGMAASIQNIIEKWQDDIRIHPGHGGASIMRDVRRYNEEYKFALTVDLRGH